MRKSLYQAENVVLLRLLRQKREEAGLMQAELSVRLGKPQSYVSKIERGERRVDVVELRRICLCLGTTLPAFVLELEAELASVRVDMPAR